MLKSFFLCVTIYLIGLGCMGQTKPYYFNAELAYATALGRIKYSKQITQDYNGESYQLVISSGANITSQLSLGIGFGLDGYKTPDYNTFPAFADAKYYLKKEGNSLFVSSRLGYALRLGDSFEKGMLVASGVGWRIDKRRMSYLPSIGYKLQRITNISRELFNPITQQTESFDGNIGLNTLFFSFAFLF